MNFDITNMSTPIYYHPGQDVGFNFISTAKIPEFVRQSGRQPHWFKGYTDADFELAHDPNYVRRIFKGVERNGFNNTDQRLNETFRYSNASLWAAAQSAITFDGVACSASQGFHHAGWDSAFGYCTFNGLIIATVKALEILPEKRRRVMIIDGDGHFGDGTALLIQKLSLYDHVRHVTRNELSSGFKPEWNTEKWGAYTRDLISNFKPGIIYYQAGADAWIDDPYGAGYLTKEAMGHRDRGIFRAARDEGVPIAWNLAGGYADDMQDTIDLHLQTLSISDEEFYRALV